MAEHANSTTAPINPPSSDRAHLERAIEDAIAYLDLLDGDPDLEESGDLEPSLSGFGPSPSLATVDAELDTSDDEWSLGAATAFNQTWWGYGPQGDYELDLSDKEPSLGAPEIGADGSQERWAKGDHRDLEGCVENANLQVLLEDELIARRQAARSGGLHV